MRRTDYAAVAQRYDESASRHLIEADRWLAALLQDTPRRPLAALDLACGTGNYLVHQTAAFGEAVGWRGLDASDAMLERARAKLPAVELVRGLAEELPYEAQRFDYLSNNFAFHHFENKPRALDEIRRVLRPGARVRIANIDPWRMRQWWGYQFFPEGRLEDEKRFWTTELLAYELEQRGFQVHVHVAYDSGPMSLADVWVESERRDASQLAILHDEQYAAGLHRVTRMREADPGGAIRSELAIVTISAKLD